MSRQAYGLIENGVLIQKQYKPQEGFVKIPDSAVCGMSWNGNNFVSPPPAINDDDGTIETEKVIIIKRDQNGEVTHRVPVMLDNNGALVQGDNM